jgi:hypothetical protein
MNRAIALLLTALALLLPSGAALAQSGAVVVSTIRWVEEWDPARGQWVRVEDSPAKVFPTAYEPVVVTPPSGSITIPEGLFKAQPVRFIGGQDRKAGRPVGGAVFGPFRVIDGKRAALVGATDAASPEAFAQMLALFPGLEVIEFVDAPGTHHDLANLRLGRAIRAAGLATHVPAGGSARSGAVELFLAGTRRTADPAALFAVHSWRDGAGREPADFAPDAPENRLYLDYYTEMGMSPDQARAFYAMTNSVPHAGALWLEGADMARWIAPDARRVDPRAEGVLRLALTRSADALSGQLAAALRAPLQGLPAEPAAPRLAYAGVPLALLDCGLLDSGAAFP